MDQEIQNNFNGLNQKFDGLTQEIESLTQIVKESFDGLENRFDGLENKMNSGFEENAREHQIIHQKLEDIELRLDNTAHNFEVRELDKRLIKVERKLGLEA